MNGGTRAGPSAAGAAGAAGAVCSIHAPSQAIWGTMAELLEQSIPLAHDLRTSDLLKLQAHKVQASAASGLLPSGLELSVGADFTGFPRFGSICCHLCQGPLATSPLMTVPAPAQALQMCASVSMQEASGSDWTLAQGWTCTRLIRASKHWIAGALSWPVYLG